MDTNKLKKKIIYRCSYTGTQETDLLYNKIFIRKLNDFSYSDLKKISYLFNYLSDHDIFNILIDKKKPPLKYKKLFTKLKDV